MLKLHYSTKDFTPNGIPIERVPLLVKEDMSFEEIPTRWFFYLAIESSTTTSPETWRGYAEAILDFFNTCYANDWQWDKITKDNIIAYRNNMLYNKNAFGKPYSKSTINNYIKRVCLFYEWAYKNKYINELPFDKEIVKLGKNIKDQYLMGHLNSQNLSYKNDLMLKEHKKIPHCLSSNEFSKILNELKERDTLIVKWSVLTGMRKKEVMALKINDIPKSQDTNQTISQINISITKGNKPRDIFVPQSLIDETNKYIKFTRRVIAKKYNTLDTVNDLWISERNGLPISKKSIEKTFREVVKKLKLDCTFHHLRHTYAIKMLSVLTKQSQTTGLNPLKTLQLLLGHANISTTMIYLEALSIDLNQIEDSLSQLYKDILNEENI